MKMIVFPNWQGVLEVSGLPANRRKSYLITIRWYLGWLRQRREVATVASARAFVDWAATAKGADGWMVDGWRAALQWFFAAAPMRREVCRGDAEGAPEAGREATALAGSSCAAGGTAASPGGGGIGLASKEPRPEGRDKAGSLRSPASRVEAKPEKGGRIIRGDAGNGGGASSLQGPDCGDEPAATWGCAFENVVSRLRREGKAYRTEQTYLNWAKRFREFSTEAGNKARWAGNVTGAIRAFLNELAVVGRVSVATQRQALNAVVYFVRHGLRREVGELGNYVSGRVAKRMREVLTHREIERLFAAMPEPWKLYARLQYGTGMRKAELLNVRIKDIHFEEGRILVRQGKGDKDRFVPLPPVLADALRGQVAAARRLYDEDRQADRPGVALPCGGSLERKYPNAGKEWRWFWLFPARDESRDPRSGVVRRHHQHGAAYQRALKMAAEAAGITKRVTSHVLRHTYATHCLSAGSDVRSVQDALGHRSLETTQVYLHLLQTPGSALPCPLGMAA